MKPEPATPPARAVVTGASSGIGREIARGLAATGVELVLPVRSRERGEAAVRTIHESVPHAVLALADLDLARPESVSALATTLLAEAKPIELLVLNAGMVALGERESRDAREPTFQINCFGHIALTMGLLPLLRAGSARVVVQCSLAAAHARLDSGSRPLGAFAAYRQSKLALALFGRELDRRSRAAGWGITVQFCHPGIVPGSEIAPAVRRRVPERPARFVIAHVGHSPADAAQTALAAAASTADSPRLYAPSGWWGMTGSSRERSLFRSFADEAAASELWEKIAAPHLT